MNYLPPSVRPRRLLLASACAVLAFPLAFAQPASSSDPAALAQDKKIMAKYDKNKNGKLDPNELAAIQADQAKDAKAPVEAGKDKASPDVVTLSPFTVDASHDQGYAAADSMAGTRLNSKLEDLASSISVVTKQQLMDTAAIDINDIFQFEVGTEGTNQFTDGTNDGRANNDAQDNVNGNPTGANRMRGLSQANITVGGFTASSSIPIDTYNINSIEIIRGPNSAIAGLSDAGGTVNLNTTGANVTRETTGVTFRGDSYGGFRSTVDINRPLIRDKLAFRFSGVYNETGYVRKPSVDRTNRQQYALTFRPFKTTKIDASFESFHEFAQRANSVTPRDTITNWISRGRPTYDPVTNTSTVNGVTTTGMASGISGIGSSNARILAYIDGGKINLLERGNSAANASLGLIAEQFTQSSAEAITGGSLFHAFGATNKAIYDWTEINSAAANYEIQRATILNLSLEQGILNTPRNRMDLQVAFRQEDQYDYRRMFLGQTDGVPMILEVDTNSRLLDGRPNPFFLHPFVGGVAPQVYLRPNYDTNYRWQLAYRLNMKQEKNFLKWIGLHNIVPYQETSTTISAPTSLRYHDSVVDNPDFLGTGVTNPTPTTNLTNSAGANIYPLYYMGDKPGEGIKYANSGPITYSGKFNAAFLTPTGWNLNDPVTMQEIYFSQPTQKKKIRTSGVNLQSFLLNDQLVATFGAREDRIYTEGNLNAPLAGNGFIDTTNLYNFGTGKKYNFGRTRTRGVVGKPFRGFSFIDRVSRQGDATSYLAEFLRGMTLYYNHSDSFKPADTAYNVYLMQLPNPRGKAEEFGIGVSMFNKFSVRLTHQHTVQVHTRSGIGVVATRAISMDFPGAQNLTFDLYDAATGWQTQLHPEFTLAQAQAAAATQIGYSLDYIAQVNGKIISDANDATSKGWELEVQFNPNKFWTLKVTGNQQEAIDSGIAVYLSQFVNERLPFWSTVKDPAGNLWWETNLGSNGIPHNYYNVNILSPLTVALGSQGLKKPQTARYTYNFVSSYRLAGLGNLFGERFSFLKNATAGGSFRWASQSAIGYYGSAPDSTGVISTLDRTKPFYGHADAHLDLFASYRMKLFNNRIGTTIQLNVKDVTENGHLKGVSVNPDGRYWQYRIIDPRQFILSASFDL